MKKLLLFSLSVFGGCVSLVAHPLAEIHVHQENQTQSIVIIESAVILSIITAVAVYTAVRFGLKFRR